MNVVALGGAPGAGKSTVTRLLIEALVEQGFVREDVRGTHKHEGRNVSVGAVELTRTRPDGKVEHVLVLGRYEQGDTFPGTDKLSMGVQPVAVHLIEQLALAEPQVGPVRVLFEGDRLFTRSFLVACARHAVTRAVVLKATHEQLEARRKGRGSDQSASWLKGRATKLDGIVRWLADSGEQVEHLENDTGQAGACAEHLHTLLGVGS